METSSQKEGCTSSSSPSEAPTARSCIKRVFTRKPNVREGLVFTEHGHARVFAVLDPLRGVVPGIMCGHPSKCVSLCGMCAIDRTVIFHGQDAGYYRRILSGSSDGTLPVEQARPKKKARRVEGDVQAESLQRRFACDVHAELDSDAPEGGEVLCSVCVPCVIAMVRSCMRHGCRVHRWQRVLQRKAHTLPTRWWS